MSVLSPELRAWLMPGLAGVLANADALGQPTITRIWAARPIPGRDRLELYVVRASAAPFLANLSRGGRAAANMVDVSSYRSRAFKGPCALSDAPIDHAFVDACLAAMNDAFVRVGMPGDAVERMLSFAGAPRTWVVLELAVEAVFDQSPKRGAGAPL